MSSRGPAMKPSNDMVTCQRTLPMGPPSGWVPCIRPHFAVPGWAVVVGPLVVGREDASPLPAGPSWVPSWLAVRMPPRCRLGRRGIMGRRREERWRGTRAAGTRSPSCSGVGGGRGQGVALGLGGGGVRGAHEVGMLQALAEAGVRPDLVLGTSVGALNGVFVAAHREPGAAVPELAAVWREGVAAEAFAGSLFGRVRTLARSGTHLHPNEPLRRLLEALPVANIEELALPFQCVAASIERAAAHWFTEGPIVEAVLASAAVPGLLPPVRVGDEHFFDGGLVHSIPVGRALELGARTVYVLHVGRIEQPLQPPTRPWEVGLVAFEIARRYRFAEDMAAVPPGATGRPGSTCPSSATATPPGSTSTSGGPTRPRRPTWPGWASGPPGPGE